MKRIYIDLDDVSADFTKAYKERWTDKIQYPQSQYGFFVNLEPIENAVESITFLKQHFDVWILTRPSIENPFSYTEKRVWVERNLGKDLCYKLIICPDKSLLKGDYLIDDKEHNFEGKSILFHKEKMNWNRIMGYFTFNYNL